jgi:hypothetical protein
LPRETRDADDVNRREFLTGAGLAASAALPAMPAPRLGLSDIDRLRESVEQLYTLDNLHGSGAVYALTTRTYDRLRGHVERATYNQATGQALRELTARTVAKAGWLSFDDGRHDDARRWWLEATHWSKLTDADAVSPLALASMSRQATEQRRSREAIDLAQAAQRTAGRAATPRLRSMLHAREALGHAGAGDGASAHAALRRAREHAETRHDADPRWLAFYGPTTSRPTSAGLRSCSATSPRLRMPRALRTRSVIRSPTPATTHSV